MCSWLLWNDLNWKVVLKQSIQSSDHTNILSCCQTDSYIFIGKIKNPGMTVRVRNGTAWIVHEFINENRMGAYGGRWLPVDCGLSEVKSECMLCNP